MWLRLAALALLGCLVSTSLSARGGGGCVAAGTLIDTPAGPRAVESLQPGDAVWSWRAGTRIPATVQAVYAVEPDTFIALQARGQFLELTAEHPVETAPGVFTRADRLTAGTAIVTATGSTALDVVQSRPAHRAAYNLLVSPGGVFFANGVLVHNKGCFLPDTPITLADGSRRAISAIQPGDRVQAYTPDGQPAVAIVQRVLTHEVDSYLVVRTDRAELHVTEEHPFYVGHGVFRAIDSLLPGESINAYDGAGAFTPQRLLAIERRFAHVTVYNLQVDGPHTYLANGVAVHNKGGGCFAAGTLIATPGGPRAIESLHLGETVLAPQPDGSLAPAAITGVYLNVTPLLTLRTTRGDLRTTAEHPLLGTAGGFQPAATFGLSARLQRAGGDTAEILAVLPGTEPVPVYTLQVAGTHTFIADGFVVHNKGGGGGGFHSSGYHSSGGSYSSGGDGGPFSTAFFLLFMIAIVIIILQNAGRSAGTDAEDLDFCFARSDIEPKAAKTTKLLEFIAKTDASVDPEALRKTADTTFRRLQECWQAREYAPMEPLLMPDLYEDHCRQIQGLRQNHEINRLESLRVEQVDLVHLHYSDAKNNRSFTALITAWLRDSYIDDRDGTFLRGDSEAARFQEFWTFQQFEGSWRLREIEQSRESDYLRLENFFAPFTETGRDQVYGETAGKAGPIGPWLPSEVQAKDSNIDRLLNFLVATDKIWNREAMLATARRCFTSVQLGWQDGRPEAFTGLNATPELLTHFRVVNEANQLHGWRVEYRNFCVRKIELIHINNRHERGEDEFTVRISAHAQVIAARAGAEVYRDEFVKPWVEFWTFRRSGQNWLIAEVLPAERGAAMVALENTDEGSSPEMLQWYYSKERAT
jgi:predicted lipid-binding transport protein (Tim44 family)